MERNYDLKHQSVDSENGLEDLIDCSQPDIIVLATVGFTGLRPAIHALERGIPLALANKEVLVVGGELIDRLRKEGNMTPIFPVDSEHSAIFQCLQSNQAHLDKVILTASGGPFRESTEEEILNATREQVLNHPTWNMGSKINVDSATMMNKGIEVIEEHYLFDVQADKIQVLVHPQSDSFNDSTL